MVIERCHMPIVNWNQMTSYEYIFSKCVKFGPLMRVEEDFASLLRMSQSKQKERIRDYLKQGERERKWIRNELIVRILAEGGMRVSELVRVNI